MSDITDQQVVEACRKDDWTFDMGSDAHKETVMRRKRADMEAGGRDNRLRLAAIRAALEAAAKAMCPMCRWGQPINEHGYHKPKLDGPYRSLCHALPIRDLSHDDILKGMNNE